MRSLRLATIPIASAALCLVTALACNPSNSASPSPETAPVATPGDPDTEPSTPTLDEPTDEPEPTVSNTGEAPTGDVALPPSSASAWNTGQSDGQPGKADRGIKDYQQIIQNNREKFRSCYDAALAKHDGIKGRVTLSWVLDPKGAVKDGAHIDPNASDFHDDFLEKCMVAALKTLTFPRLDSRNGIDGGLSVQLQSEITSTVGVPSRASDSHYPEAADRGRGMGVFASANS